jgi:nucleotide-binding universal stress UspA family protein
MTGPAVWLATDLDEASVEPWRHALRLAIALRGTLTLLHAHKEPSHNPWSHAPSPTQQLTSWGIDAPLSVELTSVEGEPRSVLPAALSEGSPDWLVVGTHRPRGLTRMFKGSMGEFLARCRGATRTLVLPAGTEGFVDADGNLLLERILVPVGGEPDQQPAIDAAVALAECMGDAPVEFVVVHCGTEQTFPMVAKPQRKNWVWNRETIPTDDVVGSILEVSVRWDASVIVMHSHGHDSLADSLFGSHAERVLRDTFAPVVVVWGG